MDMKVKDFAAQLGVSDSIIYRHIRNHREELENWVLKKAKATWLTDEAQEFIRNLMVQQPIVVNEGAAPFLEEMEQLRERIRLLENRIERKDVLIDQLQQREAAKDEQLADAAAKQLLLQQKELEAENQRQRADSAEAELDSFRHVFGSVYVKKGN